LVCYLEREEERPPPPPDELPPLLERPLPLDEEPKELVERVFVGVLYELLRV